MNRNEEYINLMNELEKQTPSLEFSVMKARKRKMRKQLIWRPLATAAVMFIVFVLLVNFSAPVAYAMSKVPILSELAEAVKFSRSLSDAVENDHVQMMELSKTKEGVTAEIVYLIVDKKQVNVFYRLSSESYNDLGAEYDVDVKSSHYLYDNSIWAETDGELRSFTVEFTNGDVPDKLDVQLKVFDYILSGADEYITEFEFLLEFDPKLTIGRIVPVNKQIEMNGQLVTITDVEVYPTHIRINIESAQTNTLWLKGLDFYIETDDGMKFEAASTGLISTGTGEYFTSYRADSTYFYDAKSMELVITGAEWLDKAGDRLYLNLSTGECGDLPEGIEFVSVEDSGDAKRISFKARLMSGGRYQLFSNMFYDSEGNGYVIDISEMLDAEEGWFMEILTITGYEKDELWLRPEYANVWMPDEEIVINIQ